jgi:putative hydrolase of the HAD superfamily
MAYVHGERSLAKFPLIHLEHNMLDLLRIKLNIETSFLVDAHLWEGMEGKGKEAERQTISDTIAQYCYDYVVRTLQVARPIVDEWSRLYPLVLVSNFYGNINTILEDFRLDTYFRHVVESSVVGIRKPDPRIFMLGVEALQLEAEEVLVVGDSFSKDILPAHSMGCQTVWIRGRGWGDESVDESLPTFIIHGLEELTGVLKQIR